MWQRMVLMAGTHMGGGCYRTVRLSLSTMAPLEWRHDATPAAKQVTP